MDASEFVRHLKLAVERNPIKEWAEACVHMGIMEDDVHDFLNSRSARCISDVDKLRFQNYFRDLIRDSKPNKRA